MFEVVEAVGKQVPVRKISVLRRLFEDDFLGMSDTPDRLQEHIGGEHDFADVSA